MGQREVLFWCVGGPIEVIFIEWVNELLRVNELAGNVSVRWVDTQQECSCKVAEWAIRDLLVGCGRVVRVDKLGKYCLCR